MKIIISIFLSFIIITLMGCAGNSHEGEAKTPSGSSIQKGSDYQAVVNVFKEQGFKNIKIKKLEDLITGWLTKDGEVESVSVDGDKEYSPDVWYSNDVEVVITYHTFPEREKKDTESAEEKKKNTESAEEKKRDTESAEEKRSKTNGPSGNETFAKSDQEILTAENNEDLAAVLAVKNEADPIIGEFAKKYAGRTIEFDGYIANMMLHGNKKTRYNILILAGDNGETTFSGPNFQFKDVNVTSDLNLTGSNIPDTLGQGQNLHITAKVKEYNESTGLFRLEPVSTEIK
ncbi:MULTISPECIES: DUF4839 domain-containing protein [Bacillus]|uniref:DUF4839 domain-containing protein n=1 Tax=Bacillus infantis NRRL B-14911 TaxID=1367477 RepID=U5LIF6_9BACI|nr:MULTISPECIES: DUF4839 domain-containing protein [Bacillus]AGX06471.1 hypothetical protein N288_23160 [Bacillus infantis NRRL B-14911]